MERDSEKILLQRCSQGEHEAYEPVVRHCEQRVFGLLYALTGSVEDARDLTQDTFIRAWRRLDRYDPEQAFLPWVFTIARNLYRDHMRRVKESRSLEIMLDDGSLTLSDHHASSDHHAITEERRALVWKALNRLDDDERELLVLKDISGLSYAELSQMMRIPKGTVASRVFYARDALRRLLPELDNSVSSREISYDVTYS
ncbi:RNA polymerase sigma factor [Gemmatimonadota bacterium]